MFSDRKLFSPANSLSRASAPTPGPMPGPKLASAANTARRYHAFRPVFMTPAFQSPAAPGWRDDQSHRTRGTEAEHRAPWAARLAHVAEPEVRVLDDAEQ